MTNSSGPAQKNVIECTVKPSEFPTTITGFNPASETALKSIYIIIIATAILLNITILFAFTRRGIKLTALNLLLLSLVSADLFTAVGTCPYIAVHPRELAEYSERMADFLCSITFGQTLFWIGNSASVFTLCILSINRYLLINHPTKPLVFLVKRRRTSLAAATVGWLLGILLVLPNFFSRKFDHCTLTCPREWPLRFDDSTYAITTTILGYGVPVTALFYTFFATVRTMWFKKRPPGSDTAVRNSRRRVVILLGTFIFVFCCCWSPFVIYWILSRTTNFFPDGRAGHYARAKANHVTILISLCNSVVNPIVYGLQSPSIKNALCLRPLRDYHYRGSNPTNEL
uniref:Neuropeptide-like GPCR n=1 Tax=Tripedalia cystophora TaxID=6141 RepID=A0A481ZLR8_TRICY|nr:neuropeptide-like GPCR [Tripedalia cystophora]